MPHRQNICCSYKVRILYKPALYAGKPALRFTIFRIDQSTDRGGPGRVVRGNGNDYASLPSLFILQLPPELMPSLIQNGFVKAGLGPDIPARVLHVSFRRTAHISDPQVFYHYNCVVFADRRAGLVNEVVPGVCDFDMDLADLGFLFTPVIRAFGHPGEFTLFPCELFFQLAEAGKRFDERSVRQGGEPLYAHVDPNADSEE